MLSPLPPTNWRSREAFGKYLKPRLLELLRAIGLDAIYERAVGDFVYHRDDAGREREVLDLLGGYGASLFGHNNPELVERAKQILDTQRPFNAQASVRGLAGLLAERLSETVGRFTHRAYVVTFANSGTEAVEAAIKHAELEYVLRLDRMHERLKRTSREIRQRLRDHTAYVPESLFEQASRLFDVPKFGDLDELFARVFSHNLEVLNREPLFLALEGAFHGKSTGSLQLTYNPDYRSPWRRLGVRTVFLPPEDPAAIARELEKARVRHLELHIAESGALELDERELVNVSACFVEPIQGEGGIREISAGYLAALRKAADEKGFPLVIDEIQSGMGRTGTFLASEATGVRGDYYVLSKALGGGLAKISALLVDRERYVADYGYLHTSTFADDDFSSAMGLGALELLDREGGALVKGVREKGEHLLRRLREVADAYPGQLAAVRGRGLMVGIELSQPKQSPSPLIRVLTEQGLLGFMVSGHLLHEERIRVAPTLSVHGTIRLEPSAYVRTEELDRFCEGLGRVLCAIRDADGFRLARFLVGRHGEALAEKPPQTVRALPTPTRWFATRQRHSRNVAFLGHFLEPGDLKLWDPSLAPLTEKECELFLERTRGFLEPFVVDRVEILSSGGEVVNLTVVGLAFTASQVMESFRKGKVRWAVRQIEQGVELAKRLGCSVVGFGGFTSIVTDNCRDIVEDEITLTSGNSLTAAAAVEAVFKAARRLGIERPRLGVLGAAGNIGAVLAEVAADRVSDILLVGRPGSVSRLERAANGVYYEAWKRLVGARATDGLAGAIAGTRTVKALQEPGAAYDVERIGEAIRLGLAEELKDQAPIRISTALGSVRTCNLILSATNAPVPVLEPAHIADGPVVVCDVATPRDVSPAVLAERPHAVVLKGGLVRAPLGQTPEIPGMHLASGLLYGCMGESILLGFTGISENYSFGRLSASRVRWIRDLAALHGFSIEEHRV
ncbi:MAG: aminotransferase class III-fold pyridoxal phosphate-dependent enzyme [Planctomycetes bacterium]|nr:aminotransferase class III-fold pyridoxal phosphate-dependent enzyme [Planctomycetota bacterium]